MMMMGMDGWWYFLVFNKIIFTLLNIKISSFLSLDTLSRWPAFANLMALVRSLLLASLLWKCMVGFPHQSHRSSCPNGSYYNLSCCAADSHHVGIVPWSEKNGSEKNGRKIRHERRNEMGILRRENIFLWVKFSSLLCWRVKRKILQYVRVR